MNTYSKRERAQIEHAKSYAKNFAEAGAPGHTHLLLIAKLVEDLEFLKRNRVNPARLSEMIEENRRK
jgi:hypothetical protein